MYIVSSCFHTLSWLVKKVVVCMQVKDLLLEMMGGEMPGQVVVACFLIREGADTSATSDSGQTPLDACSPEIAVTVSEFAKKYAG